MRGIEILKFKMNQIESHIYIYIYIEKCSSIYQEGIELLSRTKTQ